MYLVFPGGRRPDLAQAQFAQASAPRGSISYLPDRPTEGGINWFELLIDGLTFDFLGLEPGPGLGVPTARQIFGLAEPPEHGQSEACGVFAGPHIEAAAHTLPILRAHMALASHFVAALPGIERVVWSPAGIAMHPDFFVRAIDSWVGGGGFPALALIAFTIDPSGSLVSSGLGYFTGQELRLDVSLRLEPVAATRLAARLVHELVGADAVTQPTEFRTHEGDGLRLVPIAGNTIVKVERR